MSSGWARMIGWIAGTSIVVFAGIYILRSPLGIPAFAALSTSSAAPQISDLPSIAEKQAPVSYRLDGCPPKGRGGDPELNLLKNRVDSSDYLPISFESLTALTWPKSAERLPMMDWPPSARQYIERYGGTPVSVEGYIIKVREGTPDPATCNWPNSSYLDWHLALAKNARDDKAQTVLAEVTPRVRLLHTWTMDAIRSLLVDDHMPVRLSGWLYFDPEHPADAGVTRLTLWEINPVMQIQVLDKNRWVNLESLVVK